jgi:hypothetical protein
MSTDRLLFPIGIVAAGVLAASAPVTVDAHGFRVATAECQDGTCCPEPGSTCIVGQYERADKYYMSSGSCTDPKQPAPPP